MTKIIREKQTVLKMIQLYCRLNHRSDGVLCGSCLDLTAYTMSRLDKCSYKDDKPVCSECPIHCYNPKMRQEIRKVMRFSGPRMILFHPVMAIRYLFEKSESKKKFRIVDATQKSTG